MNTAVLDTAVRVLLVGNAAVFITLAVRKQRRWYAWATEVVVLSFLAYCMWRLS